MITLPTTTVEAQPWNAVRDPVDYIVLAGKASPGLCDIQGAAAARDIAVRQPPFMTGAIQVYRRRNLAEFSVRLRLYSEEDLDALREWRTIIDPLPEPRRHATALDISHPILAELDIRAVVVLSIGQLELIDDHGVWAITIKFREHRAVPKPSLAEMQGSKTAPTDPVEQQIDRNSETIDAMVKELSQ